MKRAKSFFVAALVAAAFSAVAADTGRDETPGQYIDDATITTKVKTALVKDSATSALDVKVETYRGTVQLAGFASSQAEIKRAEALARAVPGVNDVKNSILLKPTGEAPRE